MEDTLHKNNYIVVEYDKDDYVNIISENEYIDLGDTGDTRDTGDTGQRGKDKGYKVDRYYLKKRIKYLSKLLSFITDKYIQNHNSEQIIRRISRISIEIEKLNVELKKGV